jgi:uncharacterized membrane protein YhiD involved in acid resistance
MRIMAYVVSGIGLVIVWPIAAIMAGIGYYPPDVSAGVAFLRSAMAVTLFAIPLVWVISLVSSVIVHYRKGAASQPVPANVGNNADLLREVAARKVAREKKEKLLNRLAAAPYIAAACHLATWGLQIMGGR